MICRTGCTQVVEHSLFSSNTCLVDFVGLGERLTDVQVCVPERVVDVAWHRLGPYQTSDCGKRRTNNGRTMKHSGRRKCHNTHLTAFATIRGKSSLSGSASNVTNEQNALPGTPAICYRIQTLSRGEQKSLSKLSFKKLSHLLITEVG